MSDQILILKKKSNIKHLKTEGVLMYLDYMREFERLNPIEKS
jgi:hypothetical protein